MNRDDLLKLTAEAISGGRETNYGSPEKSLTRISRLWSAFLEREITPAEVSLMLALLKVARLKNNPEHVDSWVDLAGYAAIGAEAVTQKKEDKNYTFVCPKCGRPNAVISFNDESSYLARCSFCKCEEDDWAKIKNDWIRDAEEETHKNIILLCPECNSSDTHVTVPELKYGYSTLFAICNECSYSTDSWQEYADLWLREKD